MSQGRVTSVLYLCFSILVAFSNALLGRLYFFPFCLPFIASLAARGKASKYLEFAGLFSISIIIIYQMEISVGIVVLLITSALFFTFTIEKKAVYAFITLVAVLVYISVFVNPTMETESRVVYSFMFAAVYVVAASCFYIYVKEIRAKDPKNCPLEQKYLDIIDQLSEVAHESINTLKKMQEGKR